MKTPDKKTGGRKTYWIDTREGRIVESDTPIESYCFIYVRKLGLAFETMEEAEKLVEKLEIWKRLEAKGFKLLRDGFRAVFEYSPDVENGVCIKTVKESKEARKDFDALFGETDGFNSNERII